MRATHKSATQPSLNNKAKPAASLYSTTLATLLVTSFINVFLLVSVSSLAVCARFLHLPERSRLFFQGHSTPCFFAVLKEKVHKGEVKTITET